MDETHLILHEGLLALHLLQDVPATSSPGAPSGRSCNEVVFSELDLLQVALLVHLSSVTIFRRHHLLRIEYSNTGFCRAQDFQLLKVCYQDVSFPKFSRTITIMSPFQIPLAY